MNRNTDSSAKVRVYYCMDTTNMYLAFIIRNLIESDNKTFTVEFS